MKTSAKLRVHRVLAIMAAIVTTHAQAILDTNLNGMSDFWEKQYNNGNLFPDTFLATNDDDQDGWTNAKEAIAGTDPFKANPPDGIVAITITPSLVPGAFTLSWPTIIGKSYQLKASPDLVTWTNVGDSVSTDQPSHTIGISVVQPDSSFPPKLFWCVDVTDLDTDNDGLTNTEESALGTNSELPESLPGIPDLWLAQNFYEELLASGLAGVDLDLDPDGDGYTTGEEFLNGTDPNNSDAPTDTHWLILHGDSEENVEKTRTKTLSIRAGESALLLIAIASDEYPYFTDPENTDEFDDTLSWSITPQNRPPITGEIHVNDHHDDWLAASGQHLPSISQPVHYQVVRVITAPPDQNLSLEIEITGTNIGDGNLPSHIACGLLPIQVLISHTDQQGNEIDGEFAIAKNLKVAKWENAFEGNTYANGSVIDDFIAYDPDRFYVKVGNGAQIGISSIDVETTDNPIADYNDNANEIELRVMDDKASMITDSMILVSNDHDDDYAESGAGNDDANNDRTHRAQLGGNFRVSSITIHDQKHPIDLKLPVPVRKVLEVDLIRMDVEGVPQLTAIQDSVKYMNEYYAQVGLKITGVPKEKAWPAWPGRPEGYIDPFDEPEGEDVGPLTAEYKNFVNQTDSEGINLYYIKIANLNIAAVGLAITSRQMLLEDDLDQKYTKKALIYQTASLTGSTTAHELLHILAYDPDKEHDHNQTFYNLLAVENHSDTPVLWRRRIDLKQEQFIYLDPNVQNP